MTTLRTPARDTYDALVELGTSRSGAPIAYVLVKRTYSIRSDGPCVLASPEPLLHDYRNPDASPRLRPGTDFFPQKDRTDFVVRGIACAAGGKPVPSMSVKASLGRASKSIVVFGRREIHWTASGAPVVGRPEPFARMPLTYENAYGGVDRRVRPTGAVTLEQFGLATVQLDHPGMYPRNPAGKGYLVIDEPVDGLEMPNLEDPSDLLTADRLVSGAPSTWYERPRPACFDWVSAFTFPRFTHFQAGVDAWFPGPEDDRMPEVRLGWLPRGYRSNRPSGVLPDFFQEAAPELVLAEVRGDERVRIEGMQPERPVLEFALPGLPPRIEFVVEGEREPVRVRTHSVVVEPEVGRLTLLFGASVALNRTFVPGIHKHIPVEAIVDGDAPVAYRTPPTVRDQLRQVPASSMRSA
jgi:hypothetical protein